MACCDECGVRYQYLGAADEAAYNRTFQHAVNGDPEWSCEQVRTASGLTLKNPCGRICGPWDASEWTETAGKWVYYAERLAGLVGRSEEAAGLRSRLGQIQTFWQTYQWAQVVQQAAGLSRDAACITHRLGRLEPVVDQDDVEPPQPVPNNGGSWWDYIPTPSLPSLPSWPSWPSLPTIPWDDIAKVGLVVGGGLVVLWLVSRRG